MGFWESWHGNAIFASEGGVHRGEFLGGDLTRSVQLIFCIWIFFFELEYTCSLEDLRSTGNENDTVFILMKTRFRRKESQKSVGPEREPVKILFNQTLVYTVFTIHLSSPFTSF